MVMSSEASIHGFQFSWRSWWNLVDTLDLGSGAREGVRVRVSVGALGMCKLFVRSLFVHAVYPSLRLLMGDSVQ